MHQRDGLVPTAKYLTSELQDYQFKQVFTVSVKIRNMMFITQPLCMSQNPVIIHTLQWYVFFQILFYLMEYEPLSSRIEEFKSLIIIMLKTRL